MFGLTDMRIGIVFGVQLFLVPLQVVSADELSNPQAALFDLLCDLDGDGSLESAFLVSTFLNETRTSHDLASNSIFQLVAGIGTIFVNGDIVFTREFRERLGQGLNTVSCEAITTFNDPLGNEIVISVTDAQIMIVPPASPQ